MIQAKYATMARRVTYTMTVTTAHAQATTSGMCCLSAALRARALRLLRRCQCVHPLQTADFLLPVQICAAVLDAQAVKRTGNSQSMPVSNTMHAGVSHDATRETPA
jgi:hypothetical protein